MGTLQVFGGAIVFKYKGTWEIISEGDIDASQIKQIINAETFEHPNFTCIEINRHQEYTSYLIMTRKKTNTLLGLEDIQWLNLIISYLSVSLENVYLIRKLTLKLEQLAAQLPNQQASSDFIWFRKLTFELQEKERTRIATDLHDTTMQDLFFLKKRLQSLLGKYAFRMEDVEQMRSIIDYVEIINTNLRQSCFELHPYLLQEIGLVQTIRKVVDQETLLSPFHIEFTVQGADIIESKDLEMKKHLFRIVQELLNNAKKHSEASTIRLSLSAGHDSIELLYEDDGVGFDPEVISAREIGVSGIGIEQLKSRVLYLNGRMEMDSQHGRGVTVRITFPIKEVKSA